MSKTALAPFSEVFRLEVDELRKELRYKKEILSASGLTFFSSRIPFRERRQSSFRSLVDSLATKEISWTERLHRLDEWQMRLSDLQGRFTRLTDARQTLTWVSTAESIIDRFSERLGRRIEKLSSHAQELGTTIAYWGKSLEERELSLREFQTRETEKGQKLLVSKARRQPEAHYLQEQIELAMRLGSAIKGLRGSILLVASRIDRVLAAIEKRKGSLDHTDQRVTELSARLTTAQNTLYVVRDALMEHALAFEACRNRLRFIKKIVDGMTCVEDAYPTQPTTLLERLFGRTVRRSESLPS